MKHHHEHSLCLDWRYYSLRALEHKHTSRACAQRLHGKLLKIWAFGWMDDNKINYICIPLMTNTISTVFITTRRFRTSNQANVFSAWEELLYRNAFYFLILLLNAIIYVMCPKCISINQLVNKCVIRANARLLLKSLWSALVHVVKQLWIMNPAGGKCSHYVWF